MADWDVGLMEGFIVDRGETVMHETGITCPACQNNDPYASRIDFHGRPAQLRSFYCPTCEGNGYVYRNLHCIQGLITKIQPGQRDLIEAGFVTPGDAVFSPSIRAGFIGDFDRITFTFSTQVDGGQVIMRGAATLNENQALQTDLLPSQDRLWYLPDCVVWCEDQFGVVYGLGRNFTFTDKKINWINGPDPGVLYTIKYRAFMEWIVYASPMERYDQGRSLGQRVVLRKKHVHFLTNTQESPQARSDAQLSANRLTTL